MKKFLREPLLHFLLLGALLFAVYGAVSKRAPSSSEAVIVLTQGQLDSLVAVFERKWQRAPTPDERNQLVESFVRDEIFYREGVALGLDRDDTLIRRRVRQKVELLAEEAQATGKAEDAELQAYLDANRARFEIPPRVSFRQAYLDPGRSGRDLDREANRLLTGLRRGGDPDASRHAGDPTVLARQMDAAPLPDIARDFGESFAGALMAQPPGQWQGPVRSAFGLHVVLVSERIPAHMPTLDQARDAVEREWARDRRVSASDAMYRQLRQRYTVSIEPAKLAGSSP